MQRMRNPSFDRVLRGRQRLAQYLTAEDLRAANIAAVPSKYVVLDTLELEQGNQVFENRMHRGENQSGCVRPPSTAMPVPLTNTASSLARNSATLATSTGSPRRRAAEP